VTYLPGVAEAPCAICGTLMNRRLAGQGHRKFCSPACKHEGGIRRERAKGVMPKRLDGICPKCNVHPRPRRPDGGLRGWCLHCEVVQKGEYLKTEAGKATVRRWLEKSGRYMGPPEAACAWCGARVNRRGTQGAGSRRYCSPDCVRQGRNLRDRQKRAARAARKGAAK
jgi:endogenous inhibitor of DNA gyrase (YacG/DUF329 family)